MIHPTVRPGAVVKFNPMGNEYKVVARDGDLISIQHPSSRVVYPGVSVHGALIVRGVDDDDPNGI